MTKPVVTEKAGDTVEPLEMVTLAGGRATAGFAEVRLTTAPAGGAGPSMETVAPPIGLPPGIGVVETYRPYSAAGFTLTVTALETPPSVAVMTTAVGAVTKPVETSKAADKFAPPTTVTILGGDATAGFDELRATTAPAGAAGPSKVTLAPPIGLPPGIGVVERLSECTAVGRTLTVTTLETPP